MGMSSSLVQFSRRLICPLSDGTVAFGPVYVGNVTFGDFSVSQAFSAFRYCFTLSLKLTGHRLRFQSRTRAPMRRRTATTGCSVSARPACPRSRTRLTTRSSRRRATRSLTIFLRRTARSRKSRRSACRALSRRARLTVARTRSAR